VIYWNGGLRHPPKVALFMREGRDQYQGLPDAKGSIPNENLLILDER